MFISVNNGTEVTTSTFNSPAAAALSMFGEGDKEIAEFFIYTDSHGSSDRNQAEAYLNNKYDLY